VIKALLMRSRLISHVRRQPIALLALLVTLSGSSYAAAATMIGRSAEVGKDTIYGCVGSNTGRLRIVDSPIRCGKLESPISFNREGPRGVRGTDGKDGATGRAGRPGPRGADGRTGLDGAASTVAGPKGDPGASGRDGVDGRDGLDGGDGLDGVGAGTVGPKGDTGAVGAKGDTGAAGPKGDTGAAGNKGDKGDTGAAGPKGDTGAAGAKGDTGAAGAKGNTGTTGETGPKGDAGAQGERGEAGPPGSPRAYASVRADGKPSEAVGIAEIQHDGDLANGAEGFYCVRLTEEARKAITVIVPLVSVDTAGSLTTMQDAKGDGSGVTSHIEATADRDRFRHCDAKGDIEVQTFIGRFEAGVFRGNAPAEVGFSIVVA
jgi:hypothetical protein